MQTRYKISSERFREYLSASSDLDSNVGVHGTSIEGLDGMLATGEIKPVTKKTIAQGLNEDPNVAFVPFSQRFSQHELGNQLRDPGIDDALATAGQYARLAAFYSFMEKKIPGLISGFEYIALIARPDSPSTSKIKQQLFLSAFLSGRGDFFQLFEEALSRQGALLYFNSSILDLPLEIGTFGLEVKILGSSPLPFEEVVSGVEILQPNGLEELYPQAV